VTQDLAENTSSTYRAQGRLRESPTATTKENRYDEFRTQAESSWPPIRALRVKLSPIYATFRRGPMAQGNGISADHAGLIRVPKR